MLLRLEKGQCGYLLLACTVEDRGHPPTLGARELEGGLKPPQFSALQGIKAQKIGHRPIAFERADLVRTHQTRVPEDLVPWRCTILCKCRRCTSGVGAEVMWEEKVWQPGIAPR